MGAPEGFMSTGQHSQKVIGMSEHEGTKIVVLQSRENGCYTMQLFKYNKRIGESSLEDNDFLKLTCLLLAKIPIDPKFLKLN